jgi:hypothetical protein
MPVQVNHHGTSTLMLPLNGSPWLVPLPDRVARVPGLAAVPGKHNITADVSPAVTALSVCGSNVVVARLFSLALWRTKLVSTSASPSLRTVAVTTISFVPLSRVAVVATTNGL